MLKQIWIAECDLCGKTKRAKTVSGRYNETSYDLPYGWGYAHNKNFTLCPECLALKGDDFSVEGNSEK